MKLYHILPTVALGLGVAFGFTSCADDNDSNPVLHMPDTFTLNTPTLAGNTYDLKNTTDSITFTWSQPNYGGMPLATTYKLQYVVAKTGNEVVTTADGKQHEPGDDDRLAAEMIGSRPPDQLQTGLGETVGAERHANQQQPVATLIFVRMGGKHRQDEEQPQHAQRKDGRQRAPGAAFGRRHDIGHRQVPAQKAAF